MLEKNSSCCVNYGFAGCGGKGTMLAKDAGGHVVTESATEYGAQFATDGKPVPAIDPRPPGICDASWR